MRAPGGAFGGERLRQAIGLRVPVKARRKHASPDCSGSHRGAPPAHDMLDSMPNENPFQDPLRFERQVPECVIVIFGANGDLTKRKLLPALYRLAFDRRLSAGFAIVGISRTPLSDDAFREKMRASVEQFSEDTKLDPRRVGGLRARALLRRRRHRRHRSSINAWAKSWGEIESERHTGGNVLFYLSTQPSQYAPIAHGIGAAGMGKGSGWRRLVVEKPFGHDLASARELSNRLHEVFDETDVYRIDHYLGKETVQNILAFRFGNGIFEPLWNRRYVNHVQITGAESIGVEGRGAYYQEAGALDDMIQNHLLQVMATIAMEPSASFQATSVRDERVQAAALDSPDDARGGSRRTRCPGSTVRRASAARTSRASARKRAWTRIRRPTLTPP